MLLDGLLPRYDDELPDDTLLDELPLDTLLGLEDVLFEVLLVVELLDGLDDVGLLTVVELLLRKLPFVADEVLELLRVPPFVADEVLLTRRVLLLL